MRFEMTQDPRWPGVWRVEAIDYEREGVVHIALFTGFGAEEQASEYSARKNHARTRGAAAFYQAA